MANKQNLPKISEKEKYEILSASIDDSAKMAEYILEKNDYREITEDSLPQVVKAYSNANSEKVKKLSWALGIPAGALIATAALSSSILGAGLVGTAGLVSLSGALGAVGVTSALIGSGGALASTGIGAVPGLALIGVGAGIAAFKKFKSKDLSDKLKEKVQASKPKCEMAKKKLNMWIEDCKQEIKINAEKLKVTGEKYKVILKEKIQKASIQLDDMLNTNTNKRIMQYNEVIVKQFEYQKMLEEQLVNIINEYDELIKENERLSKNIRGLLKILQSTEVPQSAIDEVLGKDEKK